MGVDARAKIWLGTDQETPTLKNFVLDDELDLPYDFVLDGVEYERIRFEGGRGGFGVLLASTYHRIPPQELLPALTDKLAAVQAKVEKQFEAWGLEKPRVLWRATFD